MVNKCKQFIYFEEIITLATVGLKRDMPDLKDPSRTVMREHPVYLYGSMITSPLARVGCIPLQYGAEMTVIGLFNCYRYRLKWTYLGEVLTNFVK